jgi:DNA-binding transcriptional LysR family regulator
MNAKMQLSDWDDLRYFLAVAEKGSLSGAAKYLGVNHSTVFRRINQFEEKTAVRLFERLADGYHLTTAGELMRPHAEKIRDEADQLALKVMGRDVQPEGTVRVTAPDSLACYYINRYMVGFCKQYPGISVELNVSNEGLDLSRRETDIAVRATQKPPEHLIGRKIFSIVWAFYASEGYLQERGRPESMADLDDHSLIGPDGPLLRLAAFTEFEKLFYPRYQLKGNSLMATASLAQAGNGIVLLPDDQIHTDMVRLFPQSPEVLSDIWLLTHPELRATERIRLLSDYLVESFRSDPLIRDLRR